MNPTSEPTPPTPPTPTPDPTPPVVGRDLVEYIRTNRDRTAHVLLGLAAAFLVLTIWMAVKGFQQPATKTEQKKEEVTNPLDPFSQEKTKPTEVTDPKRGDYLIAGIGVLAGFLVTAAAGAWVLVGLPNPSEDKQRSEARILILVVGGCLGLAIIFVGALYFYRWSDALAGWLDKDEKKQMWRVMLPLVMVLVGAGLIFLAAQPARADERNNPTLRRMVYGANFGLTILLVLVMLVVGNVAFALKAPNKLDTTETGFYTLSETTKQFLGRLNEPVTAYLVMPELSMREANDIRQVLLSYQEAAGGKFNVRFVNPVTEKRAVMELHDRYPRLDQNGYGILLVSGPDDQPTKQRHAYVAAQELLSGGGMGPGGSRQPETFVGESRILRELRYLSENETRPTVYFTQSSGELSITAGRPGEISDRLSASQLQRFLESHYSLDIKPLNFPVGEANPKIPDDCGVLVVAEPGSPLPDPVVNAIRQYMAPPKRGRLIVLAGAKPGTEGRVNQIGLERLLPEYGVSLGDKYLYASPQDVQNPRVIPVEFAKSGESNQISQTVSASIKTFQFPLPREVRPMPGGGGFQAVTILQTHPGTWTWTDDEFQDRPSMAWQQIRDSEALRTQRQYSDSPRSVMVAVSESGPSGGTGRVVVIGAGLGFSDEISRQLKTGSASFDLVGASIDWLRERPPVPTSAEGKQYKEYNFPAPESIDTTRLLWLPLGIAVLSVAGLGAGVWVIRRK
jgi:hypothetical protein